MVNDLKGLVDVVSKVVVEVMGKIKKDFLERQMLIEEKIAELEKRVDFCVKELGIVAIEDARADTERSEMLRKERTREIMDLIDQLNDLRSDLTKIADEVKSIKQLTFVMANKVMPKPEEAEKKPKGPEDIVKELSTAITQ